MTSGFRIRLVATTTIAILALGSHSTVALELASGPWPMFGQNASLTHRSPFVGPTTGDFLTPTDIPAGALGNMSVTPDGLIVFGAGFSHLGVRADGTILWHAVINATPRLSSPTIASDGSFFIGDRANDVKKSRVEDGVMECFARVAKLDGDVQGSPTISVQYPDRIYYGEAGVQGGFFAVRMDGPEPCQLIWRLPPAYVPNGPAPQRGEKIPASPSGVALADSVPGNGDQSVIVYFARGRIYKIVDHGDHGEIIAQRDLRASAQGPSPMVDPATGNIYVGTKSRRFYALKPDLTDLFPPVKLDGPVRATAALSPDGRTVYSLTTFGGLWALDSQTGAVRPGFPRFIGRGNGKSVRAQSPVVDAAGTVYATATDGTVQAFLPDGTTLWQTRVEGHIWHSPTIVNGGLLVISLFEDPYFYYDQQGTRVLVEGRSKLYRFCPAPVGPPEALQVCGFTVDTTVSPP